MKKIPFYLSIDFEDYYHDKRREIGHEKSEFKIKSLWKSYNRINSICDSLFDSKKFTFFCTGVVAKAAPDLLKKISNDGHELACHYNYHDSISKTTRENFVKNLDIAIDNIYRASGETPRGFRAPNFDVKPENVWAYEEISKRFKYDSSYITSLHSEKVFNKSLFNFKKNNLFEYFIFANPFFSNKIKLRSGGTFLKLFPTSLTINTMRKSHDNGYSSLLYLHPYEFLSDYEFWIPLKDFSKYYFPKNLIKYARQIQWHKIGNKSIEKKLKKIASIFEHQGPMEHFVDK